jgi:hypothetical protein
MLVRPILLVLTVILVRISILLSMIFLLVRIYICIGEETKLDIYIYSYPGVSFISENFRGVINVCVFIHLSAFLYLFIKLR